MQALFSTKTPLVLASASPRRQLFLQELGLAYTVVRPHGIEPTPELNESPQKYAERAAAVKARFVAEHHKESVVIAADTVVALQGTIFGKPKDAQHAFEMLQALVGKGHTVISAVCCIFPSGKEVLFHESTEVFFHGWSEEILRNYAKCGEPLDKAGAYAIQGQGAFLVESIRGSWSTVVGLPVTALVACLLQHNCITPLHENHEESLWPQKH